MNLLTLEGFKRNMKFVCNNVGIINILPEVFMNCYILHSEALRIGGIGLYLLISYRYE
jgi:hypothetical protein